MAYEPQTIKYDREDLEEMVGHSFSTGSATVDAAVATLLTWKLSNVLAAAIGISVGVIQDSVNKQENMIKDAILKIADGEIDGLQLTITPNFNSNYPAVYTEWSTY